MAKITMGEVGDIKFSTQLKPSPVYDILRSSTAATANLESSLMHCGIPADKPFVIKAPLFVAYHLLGLEFNMASVADNHLMDHTGKGLADTIK